MHPEPLYNYTKFAILYVDDEDKSLKAFTRAFADQFQILTATNATDGLSLLQQHADQIGLLMTDQRMPGEKGVWLLERARQLRPRIIRMLVTAYADMDAAIAAVNTGAIYKYITKPWNPPELETTLKRGLEFFMVQRERDQLLREKLSVLHNMMIADRVISLGLLAAGLSHHIRNSLVAVKTFLDLAPAKLAEENVDLAGLRNPDFWKEYYQNVQAQIEKINGLLKDLWSASKQPSFTFDDAVQVHEVLAEVVARVQPEAAAKQIRIVNEVPDWLPRLLVDRPKFQRLFELLLRDEIVSLPAGRQVTLTARAHNDELGGTEVRVEVRDNGPGLPREALRMVFDPFALRMDNPLEYGLNLMAVFFIVHHHGGRIQADSAPGQGTSFHLRFPVNPNQATLIDDNQDLVKKVLLNESLWEKLISSE